MGLINFFLNLSTKGKLFFLCFLIFVGTGIYIGYLTHVTNQAQKKAKAEAAEAERLREQNEGLKILNNTANIAIEVENDKKIANQQQVNSNLANSVYANSRVRDSNQSSNNFNEARRRFCEEYPADSKCKSR